MPSRRKTPEERGFIDPKKYAYVICIPDYALMFSELDETEKNRVLQQRESLLENKISPPPLNTRTAIPLEGWEEEIRVLSHGNELPPIRKLKVEIDLMKSGEPHIEIN